MDTILQWIIEHIPHAAVAIVAAFIAWKARGLYQRLKHVESHVGAASCSKHSKDIEDLKQERQNMANVTSHLNTIAKWVMKFDPSTIETLAKGSPYYITPYGDEILNLSDAKTCINDNFDFFRQYINDQRPDTEYDVENHAIFAASLGMTNGLLNPVKNFIYNAPEKLRVTVAGSNGIKKDKEITISGLLLNQLMGIYIRDKYLDLFPDKSKLWL